MPPASSRNNSSVVDSQLADEPIDEPAQLYQGPPEWTHGGLSALHLFMIRFGQGGRRRVCRQDLFAKVSKFAGKQKLTAWPTYPDQAEPLNANSKSQRISVT
eukprot:10528859-Heterocapsa_arctica.AAC.1